MYPLLSYPASNAHAPYYIVICGLSGITIYFHIISKMVRFSGGEELFNIKWVFYFSLWLLSAAFLILRRIQRCITNVRTSSCEVPVILVRF
jgi:hypothetical protein